MQKLLVFVIGFGLLIGILLPSESPKAPAATAAATTPAAKGALFQAPPYQETKLQRRPDGHFYVTADVNGAPITFLVDTGASSVALSEADAKAAGLKFSASDYEPVARTASGIANGTLLTLPRVAIDGKEVMQVEAMIIEGAEVSLLGQSYLSRITSVQMNGDTMVLR